MMGEHGFLSHSLLALDRGRAQPDGATRPAGSSTATEQCDLMAVEIEMVGAARLVAAPAALVGRGEPRPAVRPRKRKARDAAADERRIVQIGQRHRAEDEKRRQGKADAERRLGQLLRPIAKQETLSAYDAVLQQLLKERPPPPKPPKAAKPDAAEAEAEVVAEA